MKEKYDFLDSSRGLAALMVVFSHLVGSINWEHYGYYAVKYFRPLYFGEGAVDYFFVLSGFVLSISIIRDPEPPTVGKFFSYVIARLFRLYPLFLFIVMLSYLVASSTADYQFSGFTDWFNGERQHMLSVDFPGFLRNLFLYPRLTTTRLIPQDWTLSLELIISVSLPAFMLLGKINKHLMLIFTFLFIKILRTSIFVFPFSLGIYICINLDIFRAYWDRFSTGVKSGLLALSLATFYASLFLDKAYIDIINIACVNINAVGAAGLMLILLCSRSIQRLLKYRFLLFLGKASYGIYLCHFTLLVLFFQFVNGLDQYLLMAAATIISTVLLSAINAELIEQPGIRLGKWLVRRWRPN